MKAAPVERLAEERERARCVALLEEHLKDAQQNVEDHEGDAEVIMRELSGYARGIRDAAFWISQKPST